MTALHFKHGLILKAAREEPTLVSPLPHFLTHSFANICCFLYSWSYYLLPCYFPPSLLPISSLAVPPSLLFLISCLSLFPALCCSVLLGNPIFVMHHGYSLICPLSLNSTPSYIIYIQPNRDKCCPSASPSVPTTDPVSDLTYLDLFSFLLPSKALVPHYHLLPLMVR